MREEKLSWKCIPNCGACCRLAPSERVEALEALSNSQTKRYLELVSSDGWCKHYDKQNKKCSIYYDRPDFCNVSYMISKFKSKSCSNNMLAIKSCRQQIRSIYGGKSSVLKRF